MILGIGIDLLDSRRIESIIKNKKDAAMKKLMTESEIEFYIKRKNIVQEFAKVFSAKEAIIKAIGDVKVTIWHDIEICHKDNGAPFVKISGETLDILKQKVLQKFANFKSIENDKIIIHISFSDELPYVSSMCIVEYIC